MKDIWTAANLTKELKKYLSTQELEDWLTKLNRKRSDFEKKQEETRDFRTHQQYDGDNNNQFTGLFTFEEIT